MTAGRGGGWGLPDLQHKHGVPDDARAVTGHLQFLQPLLRIPTTTHFMIWPETGSEYGLSTDLDQHGQDLIHGKAGEGRSEGMQLRKEA